jgi:polyhydroxyalkanoate synthesis repressor PhaR
VRTPSCNAAKDGGSSGASFSAQAQNSRGIQVADSSGSRSKGAESDATEAPTVIIKKYANRRLYNTATSNYVTLEHLSEMVREGVVFQVQDAKTEEDITRSVLTQIIVEQESRGQNLLPVEFLRRLIRFYGEPMQGFLPAYLNMSMESFTKSQEQMRETMARTFGGKTPIAAFEEQAQRNMALFQQALTMWSPFTAARAAGAEETTQAAQDDATLVELRKQMEAMQKQLDALTPTGGRKPGA